MKVLYIGNLYPAETYEVLCDSKKAFTNPSGQNYHVGLAKVISQFAEVEILSFLKDPQIESKASIPIHYLGDASKNRSLLIQKATQKALEISKNEEICVFFDALNIKAAKTAKILRKRFIIPTIGVITDKAKNITGTRFGYAHMVKSNLYYADALIAVTKALNDYYNPKRKPSLVINGVIDHKPARKTEFEKGSYIFCGGALNERFGILNLVNAFKNIESAYDLVIAGHNATPEIIKAMEGNPKIHYLGLVSPKAYHDLAYGAALNISPRPYDKKLDRFCVPSKLVEYLSVEAPIISTRSSPLKPFFEEDVNWIEDASEEALRRYLQKHIGKKGTLVRLNQNKGQAKIKSLCGVNALAKRLQPFLESLMSSFSTSSMTMENEKLES